MLTSFAVLFVWGMAAWLIVSIFRTDTADVMDTNHPDMPQSVNDPVPMYAYRKPIIGETVKVDLDELNNR